MAERSRRKERKTAAGAPQPWFLRLAPFLIAVAAYLPSLGNPLIHDDRTLLDNAWLRDEASPLTVLSHDFWFGTRHAGSDLYRPLTTLLLAWNLRLAPSRVAFHAVNGVLHGLCAVLLAAALGEVWRTLGRRAGGRAPVEADGAPPGSFSAFAGAALFAVHPLTTEAVVLAVGRAEILAAAFGLSAFLLLARLDEDEGPGGWRLAASAVLFLAALASKESAACWIVLGGIWWAARRAAGRPARGPLALRGVVYLAALAVFVAARGTAVGFAPHAAPPVDNPLASVGGATRLANAVVLQGRYLLKMLLPVHLTTEYGFDQTPVVALVPWGGAAALAIAAAWLGVLGALWRMASPGAAFLWAWIPAAFCVTGNLAFPIGTIFAERLAYLPLAGACGLAGLVLASSRPSWRWGAIAVLVAAAATRSIARERDFASLVAYQEATVRVSPRSAKALFNLGRTRLDVQRRPEEAIELLRRAVEILPDYAQALRTLSEAYASLDRPSEAADWSRRAEEAERRRRASGP